MTDSSADRTFPACSAGRDNSLGACLVRQFRKPSGFWGRCAGWVMSYRSSNVKRNQWTISLLNIHPNDKVLEIGFGPGRTIQRIAGLLTQGEVWGIDHSRTMLEMAAQRNASAIDLGRVVLHPGTVHDLATKAGYFDKILAVNVVQFWEDPAAELLAIRRLMAAGAVVALTYQPRRPGATDAEALSAGQAIAASLTEAGFTGVRVESLPLRPVCAISAVASS